MPEGTFASWISDDRKVVLTDDFVPVDYIPLSAPGGGVRSPQLAIA